jgi:hypothetical protein
MSRLDEWVWTKFSVRVKRRVLKPAGRMSEGYREKRVEGRPPGFLGRRVVSVKFPGEVEPGC